jgi:hypothetical protein
MAEDDEAESEEGEERDNPPPLRGARNVADMPPIPGGVPAGHPVAPSRGRAQVPIPLAPCAG